MDTSKTVQFEVIADPKNFDQKSGNRLERLIFNNRKWVVIGAALITALFAFQLRGLVLTASYRAASPLW